MSGSVTNVLRVLSLGLDKVVYWLVDQAYYLFTLLTEVSIFTQSQIEDFASRIYVLISIIMLFKLGFSFITYIVNPDSFTDKQKGGAALIKKIVICIALLVSVPTIFNEAYYLQKIIFQNNLIEKVLLNNTVDTDTENNDKASMLSTYAFLSFFTPNSKLAGCGSNDGLSISSECINSINSLDDARGNHGSAYEKTLKTLDRSYIMNTTIVNATATMPSVTGDDFFQTPVEYLFDYHAIVSTVFGVALAWILIGFCLDLAVRAVKLGFLQIIAPIPIILSISPQQKTNTLANWGKECLSTWASLFIRVLVISFSLTIISIINSGGGIFSFVTGGSNQNVFVSAFVMLGILLFAKEFPKLLEDILGIKGAGKMTFNALKRMTEAPLVGSAIGKGAAYAGAGLNWARKTLGNGLAYPFEAAFADRFRKNPETGERLSSQERKDIRQRRLHDRMTNLNKETSARAHADPTKKYTGDTQRKLMHKQNAEERAQRKTFGKDFSEGEKLFENASKNGKYSIYSSGAFAESVENMDKAKDIRDKATGEYEKMRMRYEKGEQVTYKTKNSDGKEITVSGADAVNEARVASLKASGDYDKAKAEFEVVSKVNKSDAERYKQYTTAEDRHKVINNVTNKVNLNGFDYQPGQYTPSNTTGDDRNFQINGVPVHIDTRINDWVNDNGEVVQGVPEEVPASARSTSTTSGTPANNSSNNQRPSSGNPGINSGFNSGNSGNK